jgi:glycosyltransferase involved in cell wall biosynthesis
MDMSEQPLVSIVTPSFNQGRFVGETLRSVAEQSYPYIEHIIIDGQSADDSLAVIKAHVGRYPGRVTWVSEPDQGQADAINKGLRRASGTILAYLNSDDTYTPDAVKQVVDHFQRNPDISLVHGQGFHMDTDGNRMNAYPSQPCDHRSLFENCYICQPTTFWRRDAFDAIGEFNTSLRYAMDYDYWIRLSKRFSMAYLNIHLANTRLHREAKTVQQRNQMHREILQVVKSHYGAVSDHWIYSYANSFPWIDRLRTGRLLSTIVYVIAFTMLSGGLFLKHNHRIPLRSIRLFFNSIPHANRPGRLS